MNKNKEINRKIKELNQYNLIYISKYFHNFLRKKVNSFIFTKNNYIFFFELDDLDKIEIYFDLSVLDLNSVLSIFSKKELEDKIIELLLTVDKLNIISIADIKPFISEIKD